MNNNLNKARKEKDDEFYTHYGDIGNEVKHYHKGRARLQQSVDPKKTGIVLREGDINE